MDNGDLQATPRWGEIDLHLPLLGLFLGGVGPYEYWLPQQSFHYRSIQSLKKMFGANVSVLRSIGTLRIIVTFDFVFILLAYDGKDYEDH